MQATRSTSPQPVDLSRITSIVVFSAVSAASMGFPLAVLPTFVHDDLGFGATVTGLVLSAQALTTLAVRPLAGRLSDRVGVRSAVTLGLAACAASGLLTLVATSLPGSRLTSLALLAIGRLILGFGMGLTNTGTLSWGIGVADPQHASRVISYNGIAAFGALALTPPLGAVLADRFGIGVLGGGVLLMGLAALAWTRRLPAPRPIAGAAMSFLSVFGRIAPLGLALGLGSAGLAGIATFSTLFFAQEGWHHAALAMTAFGLSYVGTRLLFADAVERFGGTRVAVACFVVEIIGLATMWLAPVPAVAMLGAGLTGFGMSLVYPALGTEVVARVPPSSRSSALGAFSLCMDLSTGLAGPICGAVASVAGFRSVFLFAALLALAALVVSLRLHHIGFVRREQA